MCLYTRVALENPIVRAVFRCKRGVRLCVGIVLKRVLSSTSVHASSLRTGELYVEA